MLMDKKNSNEIHCQEVPFLWPDIRMFEIGSEYENMPPFEHILRNADGVMAFVPDLKETGIDLLETWLENSKSLRISLIVLLYPACATKQVDLIKMDQLFEKYGDRLEIRLHILKSIEDIPLQMIMVSNKDDNTYSLIYGPSSNFGLVDEWRADRINVVAHMESSLIEAFRRWFDWMWFRNSFVFRKELANIPHLVRPKGTQEARQMWNDYVHKCETEIKSGYLSIDKSTGDVTLLPEEELIRDKSPEEIKQTSEDLKNLLPSTKSGFTRIDPISDEIVRLFRKGMQATINTKTRVKPLNTPISPRLFGDESLKTIGRISIKTSYSISIFSEAETKKVESLRKSTRDLLNTLSFGISDGLRWVPLAAKELLKKEIDHRNIEAKNLLCAAIKTDNDNFDVEKFIEKHENILRENVKEIFSKIYSGRKPDENQFAIVKEEIASRINMALKNDLLPNISYNNILFDAPRSDSQSGWESAYTLLLDIAKYPRKIIADGQYFKRNFRVIDVEQVKKIMNVLDDKFYVECKKWDDYLWAKETELPKFIAIEESDASLYKKCLSLWKLMKTNDWDAAYKILEN
jgi:hypothetical protein